MDQLPRLGKRELICLLLFTCNYVVSVWRGFLFLWVLGMGYVTLLWHSLGLPYNYSVGNLRKTIIIITNIDLVNDYVYTEFGLFVFKILSKNSILTSIKGRNSVANLPKFELIQDFMHVLVTCKNEGDQFKNEGARLFTRFLPL